MRSKAALILVPALFLAAGCASATGREVNVEMSNFRLAPAAVEVKAGETVQFVLNNKSDTEHEFESTAGKFDEITVPAGKTRKVAWTAPNKAGQYEFECDMAGHEGMIMTVNVTQ
ncbi:MAG TPA: cupredoxin domain-containing protein [Symbiobacteriaceae bacterium]|nr:cupredoxin domain-containing protein [Symbiobacteriaceae bacterium]